jgi:hypothetical protein
MTDDAITGVQGKKSAPRIVLILSCPLCKRSLKQLPAKAWRQSTLLAKGENFSEPSMQNGNDLDIETFRTVPCITPHRRAIRNKAYFS